MLDENGPAEAMVTDVQSQIVVNVTEPHPLLMKIATAAPMLGMSRNAVRDLIRNREIGFVRSEGGVYRIPLSAINEWISRNIIEPQS